MKNFKFLEKEFWEKGRRFPYISGGKNFKRYKQYVSFSRGKERLFCETKNKTRGTQ